MQVILRRAMMYLLDGEQQYPCSSSAPGTYAMRYQAYWWEHTRYQAL